MNCKEATELSLKKNEGEVVPLGARIQLFMHLLICRYCKLFVRQSERISRAMDELSQKDELTSEEKVDLKRQLDQSGATN